MSRRVLDASHCGVSAVIGNAALYRRRVRLPMGSYHPGGGPIWPRVVAKLAEGGVPTTTFPSLSIR